MTTFNSVEDIENLPVGKYVAYLEDGEPAYLEVFKIANGNLAAVNGHFSCDMPAVIAYAPFPDLVMNLDGAPGGN